MHHGVSVFDSLWCDCDHCCQGMICTVLVFVLGMNRISCFRGCGWLRNKPSMLACSTKSQVPLENGNTLLSVELAAAISSFPDKSIHWR